MESQGIFQIYPNALREIAGETDAEKRDAKLKRVLDNLQKTLEA